MIERVQPETTHTPHKIEFGGAEGEPPARSPQDGELDGNGTAVKIISRLIAQARRGAGHLALRETQLAAVRHGPQIHRAALNVAVALGIVLAFLTASALASWAAVSALAEPLPGWAAPLLLAAAWIGIGISLVVFALNRGDRVLGWRRMRKRGADEEQRIGEREWAGHETQQSMRESLERLAGEVGERAGALASSAVVPVASSVISAGEHVIDQIDKLTDDLGKAVPGGGVINRVVDGALRPGRHLVSLARTALEGPGDELNRPDQPSSTRARRRKASGPDRRNTA